MADLSPEAMELFAAGKTAHAPTSADEERVLKALALRLGATGAAGALLSAELSTSSKLGWFGKAFWLSKWGGMTAFVGVSGLAAVGVSVHQHAGSSQVAPTHSAAPARTAQAMHGAATAREAAPATPALPTPILEVPTAAATTASLARAAEASVDPTRSKAKAASSSSTLERELQLLHAAQTALRSGDAGTALARCAQHAHDFPRGALVEERTATRVLALFALGRNAIAEREAQSFLRAFPSSPEAPAIREASAAARPQDDR